MNVVAPAGSWAAGTGVAPAAGHLTRDVGLVAAVASIAIATALGVAGADSAPLANGLLRGGMVAAPLLAARYALRNPAFARFGRLLIGLGVAAFVSSLAELDAPVAYSIGRVGGWAVELLLAVMLLSFPTGRLQARVDRVLAGLMVAVTALVFLPALVLSPTFPSPSPYTSCTEACPPNAFYPFAHAVIGFDPADVGAVLVFGLMVAIVARLGQRSAEAGSLRRRLFVPILAVAAARTALVGIGVIERLTSGPTALADVSLTLVSFGTPLLAVAFLVGLARMRIQGEAALCAMAAALRRPSDPRMLRCELAAALDDPSLEIVFPAPDGGWIDLDGRAVTTGSDDPRRVHPVRDGNGAALAGLRCDPVLAEDPALLDAGMSMASVAVQNLRLRAERVKGERELRRSRARIAATADRERRRIERDLHDGAQQRLVALRIELSLLEELVFDDPDASIDRIRALGDSTDAALEDLRSLAHGVRPSVLGDRGLAEALRAVAGRASVATEVYDANVGRQAPEVESAVYFCVLEAVQNAAKHADGVRRVEIRLWPAPGVLCFSVRDDGAGVAGGAFVEGAGMTNMHDRVAAVGGGLTIASRPGLGVTVRGEVPLATPIAG